MEFYKLMMRLVTLKQSDFARIRDADEGNAVAIKTLRERCLTNRLPDESAKEYLERTSSEP